MKSALYIIICIILTSCAAEKDYLVTIKTNHGDMKAILYDNTPKHKENFLKLINTDFYDSLLFHRVIKGFMIQGGDPNSRSAPPEASLGNGGPGYTIPSEFNEGLFHVKGALAAARQSDQVNPQKESSGSQFYIVQGKVYSEEELILDMNKLGVAAQQMMQDPKYDSIRQLFITLYQTEGAEAYSKKLVEMKDFIAREMNVTVDKNMPGERVKAYTSLGGVPHLDDAYTVFGRVIDGLEVIDKIAAQPTGRADRPETDIHMVMEVEELPKQKITKLYGYEYSEPEK